MKGNIFIQFRHVEDKSDGRHVYHSINTYPSDQEGYYKDPFDIMTWTPTSPPYDELKASEIANVCRACALYDACDPYLRSSKKLDTPRQASAIARIILVNPYYIYVEGNHTGDKECGITMWK
jgi:hypothetical protein